MVVSQDGLQALAPSAGLYCFFEGWRWKYVLEGFLI